MPGRLFLTRPAAEVAAFLGVDAVPEDPPRRNIAPGQEVIALGAEGAARMRWGLIPVGRRNARGRPVLEMMVNARSETLFEKSAWAGLARAVVPAEGWYEWTGARGRKTAWRIRAADGGLLAFAAVSDVWVAPGGRRVAQLATVTCPPSADVAAVHDRMGVLLRPGEIAAWLSADDSAAAALMRPASEGTLTVAEAGEVDWQAP